MCGDRDSAALEAFGRVWSSVVARGVDGEAGRKGSVIDGEGRRLGAGMGGMTVTWGHKGKEDRLDTMERRVGGPR